ncbi:PLP-dependent aminotransferase family protein [Billgrantia gudaonensis]|uniref:2-aminoadipate transaminase n=1 Tax=Billgrantia gudaonensis TaxID=376427 RepID=A0A1G8MN21_9GAMM|nr:PLP-dependent aminotransferase family protein [Halomonas gudaonensis]SDI69314.1 2-aminoadipate transaminase [Halomonas gudaonensis]
MQWPFSRRAQALTSSAIREILKVTEQPDVISFAGGLPSAATFPVEAMRAATRKVLAERAESALQYGPSEGLGPLREWIAAQHSADGSEVRPSQVLLTTGSQQALDLIAKALIDPGSRVLVETPTYLGALQAFSLFEPDYVSVASDEQGLLPEALTPEVIEGARFLYALPNFQNPTGRRLPLARREALAKLAREQGLPIIEDDPYGDLDYQGERLASLRSLAPQQVIHLGSFSKVLAPGLRLGYVIADEPLIAKLVQVKQAADLHTPSFTQQVVHEIVSQGFLKEHIPGIRALYAERCGAMLAALERHMPRGVHWNRPEGGMFIRVTLPEALDSTTLLGEAIRERVAFVPGAPFYATAPRANTLRLSFVTVAPARIEEGVARLGRLIATHLEGVAAHRPVL